MVEIATRPDLTVMSAALGQAHASRILAEIAQVSNVLAEHLADLVSSVDPELQTALEMAVIAAERIGAMANSVRP